MSKGVSKATSSLKQLGEIQVDDWDFMSLMNKDIKEVEISRSLRRLANIRVIEWDFRAVFPAVSKLANQEVDLVDIFKRTAYYKVIEWDFRNSFTTAHGPASPKPAKPAEEHVSPAEIQAITARLKNFLNFVAVNLIDEPDHALIKVQPLASNVLLFKLVLTKRDVAMLIGRQGHTAGAIRSILKSTAAMNGVRALLQIHSHEEEMALMKEEKERS